MKSEQKNTVCIIGIECARVLDYTTVAMKCTVFLNVTPCSLEDKCKDSEERAICIMRREEKPSLLPSRCRLEISRKFDA